jgi:hypothetical protein
MQSYLGLKNVAQFAVRKDMLLLTDTEVCELYRNLFLLDYFAVAQLCKDTVEPGSDGNTNANDHVYVCPTCNVSTVMSTTSMPSELLSTCLTPGCVLAELYTYAGLTKD